MVTIYLWLFCFGILLGSAEGGYCSRSRICYSSYNDRCGLWGWHRCRRTRSYTCYYSVCCAGYRGSSCNIPICTTPCYNGGTCTYPDTCACKPPYAGDNCQHLLCSHKSPCFPGSCSYPDNCQCFSGFQTQGSNKLNRCLQFSGNNNQPIIEDCEITLAYFRRHGEHKELYYFNFPCSGNTTKDTIWCNEPLFNYVNFTMQARYPPLEYIPRAPSYVHEHGFGIIYNAMEVLHTKHPRAGTDRHVALRKTYTCDDVAFDKPATKTSTCIKIEPNYVINLEDDDTFSVTYTTKSGGFRKLYNGRYLYRNQEFTGATVTKVLEFKFDFIAPIHCSETNATNRCTNNEKPIGIDNDITESSIHPHWEGWTDSIAGIGYYLLEAFHLQPTINDELTELEPLKPFYTKTFDKTFSYNTNLTAIIPPKSGMYSILLSAFDKANNSKVARRLVLYDNDSRISLTKPGLLSGYDRNVSDVKIGDGGMYVVSALSETGYMWQTSVPGIESQIIVDWKNHFVNKLHKNGKLLNKVLPYPTQFAVMEDDAVLRSTKHVLLDDNEGLRTVEAIPNVNSIIKFEVKRVYSDDRKVPEIWDSHPLSERLEFNELLSDGSHVRIWIRATDIMNHTLADYTEVHIDNTPPRVADKEFQPNLENGTYTYTSRTTFIASDDGSGVHKLGYKLYVGNELHESGNVHANINEEPDACDTDPNCNCVLNKCYLREQVVDIDNCWFLVPKSKLNDSASLVIDVYNQALLAEEISFDIGRLSDLHGLEEYSGPTNIRVEEKLDTGVRLAWDLPEKASCYGRADIQIILVLPDGTVREINVYNEESSVDLVGLDPEQSYTLSLNLGFRGTELSAASFQFQTAKRQNFIEAGAVAGIIISVLVIIGILIAIIVVLLRRGRMKPIRRGLTAMSVKYRKSVAGLRNHLVRQEADSNSLYMYGEVDFKDVETWQMSRDDIVFETLLKSGNFADIYKATLLSRNMDVVAKTLKQNYTSEDEYTMKAKINFSTMVVGQHENVLHFVGAVIDNSEIGPFMVMEYCSNGTMKDYVESLKSNVTLETHEKLLRFGLGLARGMEYLASKNIVHRRLAARNILLDTALEVKISGFGPQPDGNAEGDGNSNKRERIPMKWMAPECMKSTVGATEKSDVWSYGVVLWEIFSFGESPYEDIKGRDLPARLKGGYRLPKPEQCEDKWYQIMKKTWSVSPKSRPTFSEIRTELDEVFVSASVDDYYYCRK